MRGATLVILLVAAVVGCLAQVPPYTELWFEANVDNFNSEVKSTFPMRYLVVDQFWTHNIKTGVPKNSTTQPGPIFFYTGNEGDIMMFYKNTGFMFEIAPQFNALVVFAEHRYYGKSLPFGDQSWFRGNIGYLSVEQTLADFAQLIVHLKSTLNAQNSAVVAFGGSYGGMLTTYLRLKYPHLADAALAASAPILFTGSNVDYTFFQAITDDFAGADPTCPGLVRQAFSDLLNLASQGAPGYAQLTQQFSLCSAIQTPADAQHLLLWVVNAFTSIAMCDYPYPTGFLAPLPAWPVNVACKIMTGKQDNSGATLLSRLSQAAGLFYNGTTGTLPCFNITDEFIECADQTGCGTGPDGLAWDYQACAELNYLPSTNNITDMFPPRLWDINRLNDYCRDTWNIGTKPDWLNVEYALTTDQLKRAGSNIIFSNGLLDPWHVGGVLENLSDTLVAVIIKDGAHHLDLRSSNKDDPQSVIDARKQEVLLLHKWIDQARATKYSH